MRYTLLALLSICCFTAAHATPDYALVQVFKRLQLERPLALLQAESGRRYVIEQGGRIITFTALDGADASVFADLSPLVDDGPMEAGLLGMALHPQFAHNGQVFLSYTRSGKPLTSVIARYQSRDGGRTLAPDSAQTILTVEQPYANHNGGHLAFGPDGYLYIGFGDGGAGGDPSGQAQNTNTLLGSLLRLDVTTTPYTIPADNPFVRQGGRPEIYAYGLRNPWRWSFDRHTGRLWAGDVGQNRWEEIDVIVRGGNYGWNLREGSQCYKKQVCDERGLVAPIAEYNHSWGCAVTGGYVYRGAALPRLRGSYVYGDFCSGRIWRLNADAPGQSKAERLLDSGLRIASFAEDRAGELYVLDYSGRIYQLVAR